MNALPHHAPIDGAGFVTAANAVPTVGSGSRFDHRLAEWKRAHAQYLATCEIEDVPDTAVEEHCGVASRAYHALLRTPALDALGLVEKLNALTIWSEGCPIEAHEVNALGAEAAALLQKGC